MEIKDRDKLLDSTGYGQYNFELANLNALRFVGGCGRRVTADPAL